MWYIRIYFIIKLYMPDYTQGTAYKIVPKAIETTDCYVGSTTQPLSDRMTDHRKHYKYYKDATKNNLRWVSIYDLFDKYGPYNCEIIALPTAPCLNKEELRKIEQQYIDDIGTFNERNAFRSNEEIRIQKRVHRNAYFRRIRAKIPPIECGCGSIVKQPNYVEHLTTKKHQSWATKEKLKTIKIVLKNCNVNIYSDVN